MATTTKQNKTFEQKRDQIALELVKTNSVTIDRARDVAERLIFSSYTYNHTKTYH